MKTIGLVLLGIIGGMIRGFATLMLWRWFLVPLGIPSIGMWHAIGVAILVGFTTKQISLKKQESDETLQLLVADMFWALLVLMLGALVNLLAF